MRFKCAFILHNVCFCSANSWSNTVQNASLCRIIPRHIPVCTALICWSDLDPPFQTPFWERGLSRGACGETGKVYKETKMGEKSSELRWKYDQKIEQKPLLMILREQSLNSIQNQTIQHHFGRFIAYFCASFSLCATVTSWCINGFVRGKRVNPQQLNEGNTKQKTPTYQHVNGSAMSIL